MAVKSIGEYVGVPRDLVENFAGKQLVYVNWQHHLMFAAPFLLCLEPETPFGDLVNGPLSQLIAADPDSGRVDWDTVEWWMRGERFTPDMSKSLAENGIEHKDHLVFVTPGLNTLCGGTD